MRFKQNTYIALVEVLTVVGLFGLTSTSLAQGDTWTTKAPMPTARSLLSTSAVNGKIYAMGGQDFLPDEGTLVFSTVEEYDPATDTWTRKTRMPTKKQWLSTSAVNGKIYAIGGDAHVGAPGLATVEEYDPATDTWTKKRGMPTARFALSTSVVDGKIYAIGGFIRPGSGNTAVVEAYDPAANTWTKKADMPTARFALATSVVDGKIYAIGGAVSPGGPGLATVEMYDPVANTWTTKASMPTRRATFLSTSAVNGIIYVIGGVTGHTSLATVEAYDSARNIWTQKTSMPTARGFLGTSAVNERIYAIGGTPGASLVQEYTPPGVTSVADPSGEQNNPTEFVLYQNYPNPFNPATTIVYSIPERDFVTLKVYDLLGRELQTLVSEFVDAGTHSINFDASKFASGVYFYKLQIGNFVETRKMLLIR